MELERQKPLTPLEKGINRYHQILDKQKKINRILLDQIPVDLIYFLPYLEKDMNDGVNISSDRYVKLYRPDLLLYVKNLHLIRQFTDSLRITTKLLDYSANIESEIKLKIYPIHMIDDQLANGDNMVKALLERGEFKVAETQGYDPKNTLTSVLEAFSGKPLLVLNPDLEHLEIASKFNPNIRIFDRTAIVPTNIDGLKMEYSYNRLPTNPSVSFLLENLNINI